MNCSTPEGSRAQLLKVSCAGRLASVDLWYTRGVTFGQPGQIHQRHSMTTPTRQRLVEAAVRRFYRDGFRNVGIDQVLADVGISKTAFYKHFESKEDLMLAALDNHNRWLQET